MNSRMAVGLVLATGLLAKVASADEWTKNWSPGAKPEIRVDSNDASVHITATEGSAIDARVTTSGWKIGPGEVVVTERQTGGRVELSVRIPQRHFQISFGNNRKVEIELHVPKATAVDIHTGDGSIIANGLQGSARLVSGDGKIEAEGLRGTLDARSGDGHIRVRGKFDNLSLETGDGSIEAVVESGSRMAGPWRLHTGDGHVTLRLPAEFAADLDAHTGDGRIDSGLSVMTSSPQKEHDLRGKLNGGGASLVVHTGDGSIRLERM